MQKFRNHSRRFVGVAAAALLMAGSVSACSSDQKAQQSSEPSTPVVDADADRILADCLIGDWEGDLKQIFGDEILEPGDFFSVSFDGTTVTESSNVHMIGEDNSAEIPVTFEMTLEGETTQEYLVVGGYLVYGEGIDATGTAYSRQTVEGQEPTSQSDDIQFNSPGYSVAITCSETDMVMTHVSPFQDTETQPEALLELKFTRR